MIDGFDGTGGWKPDPVCVFELSGGAEVYAGGDFGMEFRRTVVLFDEWGDWTAPSSKMRHVWAPVGEGFVRCEAVLGGGTIVGVNHCCNGVGPVFDWDLGVVQHGGYSVLHGAPEAFDGSVLALGVGC